MAKETSPGYTFDWLNKSQPDLYKRVIDTADQSLDISIRINSLKSEPKSAIKKWSGLYNWKYEPVPFCPSGFWIRESEKSPSRTLEHRLGYFYIQEAASMLPAELFDFNKPEVNEKPLILDMAASPGGKTIHLVDRSHDKGFILANDASRGRIQALRIVLENWGAINQAITCLPGEMFGALYPNTFDAILLDAPCSMQGLRAVESHKARAITISEVEALAARQTRLLESALRAVKIGGQVVYSTCTLTPQEDEGVLAALLKKFPGCFEIEDVQKRLPLPAPGLDGFNGNTFPDSTKQSVRLWPHIYNTAGFFAAKLVKTGPMPSAASAQKTRPAKTPKIAIPQANESRSIIQNISDLYGFDLENVIQSQSLQIVEFNGHLNLIPEALLSDFPNLPWLSSGMLLGKALPNGWQPSHAFVSRFGNQFTNRIMTLEDEYLMAWERGEDLRGYTADSENAGKVVALRDKRGRNLGRAKVLKDRLKNMLPTRLF